MRLLRILFLVVIGPLGLPTLGHAGPIQYGVPVDSEKPVPGSNSVFPKRPALAIVIQFDETSAPCIFQDTSALRSQYAGLGVTFSGPGALDGGGILDECSNFSVTGHSSPNFVGFNANGLAHYSDGGHPFGPERMDLSPEVAAVQLGIAGPGGGLATLSAFSADNVLLATDSRLVQTAMQSLGVSVPGIAYVTLDVQGADPDAWVFDDLSFDAAPTSAIAASWGRMKSLYR